MRPFSSIKGSWFPTTVQSGDEPDLVAGILQASNGFVEPKRLSQVARPKNLDS